MPQIYKLLIQLNCKKQTIWSKNGQRIWSDIFPNKRTMANRYMKNLSILLIIRKMQIKTTMRYYLTPVRIVMIKKMRDNKCWQGCREKRTVMHHNGECKLVHPLQKTVWWFLKKLKRKLPYYPAIPLLGLYLEKKKKRKYVYTPMFIAALFTTAKTWKQPKHLLMDEWIKKLCYVCACACMRLVTQLYPTLWNPMDNNLPGSSVHGILPARILAWVAISFSKGSSRLRDQTHVF